MATESSTNAERAAEIMVLLGEAGSDGLSLGQLSLALGSAKPATSRALVALSGRGFVEMTGKRGQYRLGPAIYALANRASTTADLVRRFRPAVIDIAAETGRSTYLMMRAGFDAICVDMHEGTAFVQTLTGGIGGRVPLGIGPGTLSIMIGIDADAQAAIINHNKSRYPRYDGATERSVRALLKRAMALGFSYDIGESIPDAGGVGVPIPQDRQNVSAAISIGMPAALLDVERAHELHKLIRACIDRRM